MAESQRSWMIKLAVAKKVLFALVLLGISGITGFTWRNNGIVTDWAQTHVVNAEFSLVRWGLTFLSQAPIPELKLIARLSGLYAGVILIAAWGVWRAKVWAFILFAGLVGLLLPVEIWELSHDWAWETLLLFVINLLIFGYFSWEAWHLTQSHSTVPEPSTSKTQT